MSAHAPTPDPSPWVVRFAPLVRAPGEVLDVACGSGRHTRLLAALGHRVQAVDRDAAALELLSAIPNVTTICADIEGGPWPFAGLRYAAVVVTNYLHRPLLPTLVASLGDGGLLIYETFAQGNERYGRPSNPDFLLAPGELLRAVQGLRVIAYEDVRVDLPKPALIQRVCAIHAAAVPGW
jgi:SAM-dependent methyltransferase